MVTRSFRSQATIHEPRRVWLAVGLAGQRGPLAQATVRPYRRHSGRSRAKCVAGRESRPPSPGATRWAPPSSVTQGVPAGTQRPLARVRQAARRVTWPPQSAPVTAGPDRTGG
eukprot:scaffold1206_cov388-Prasinococcus_capsulatus_cf.AAC.22